MATSSGAIRPIGTAVLLGQKNLDAAPAAPANIAELIIGMPHILHPIWPNPGVGVACRSAAAPLRFAPIMRAGSAIICKYYAAGPIPVSHSALAPP